MKGKYAYRNYDPAIVEQFARERARLARFLGDGARIEHIGSTSVPGLGGKGLLDIMVGVRRADIPRAKRLLSSVYEFHPWASVPLRSFFVRECRFNGKENVVHLHLVAYNGDEWRVGIVFRDYLRTHPGAAREYMTVKRRAARACKGDGRIYREMKRPFIEKTLRKAGYKRKRYRI